MLTPGCRTLGSSLQPGTCVLDAISDSIVTPDELLPPQPRARTRHANRYAWRFMGSLLVGWPARLCGRGAAGRNYRPNWSAAAAAPVAPMAPMLLPAPKGAGSPAPSAGLPSRGVLRA